MEPAAQIHALQAGGRGMNGLLEAARQWPVPTQMKPALRGTIALGRRGQLHHALLENTVSWVRAFVRAAPQGRSQNQAWPTALCVPQEVSALTPRQELYALPVSMAPPTVH
jgi:hypothetical protein